MNDYELKYFLQICMVVGVVLSGIGIVPIYIGYTLHDNTIMIYGVGWGIGNSLLAFIAGIILLSMTHKGVKDE